MKAKEIRFNARESMSGKWGRFVGMNLLVNVIAILAMVVAFIPMISSLFSVVSDVALYGTVDDLKAVGMVGAICLTFLLMVIVFLFVVPLSYSFLENMINLKRDNNTKATEFLKLMFKRFGRAWKVGLWCVFKILVLYLIFILAMLIYIILLAIVSALEFEVLQVILVFVLFVGMIAYMVLLISRLLSLILAQYIAIDNPDYLAKQCVEKSMELMKGYKWKYICLNFSFIGWMILASITFGIGYVFLYPYMQVSYICFYEKVLEEKKETVVETSEV